MVEPMMFFGLGFLASCLIALVIVPLVHARAVRLTTRRIQASAPVSIAEIRADKDQLRAEFAMSTRRLEMSVEQLKSRTTGQLADLGRKSEAVNKLKLELNEKAVALAALETREKVLQDQLRINQEELGLKSNAMREAERKLAEREAEFAKLGMNFEERSVAADSHRIEIVALKTQAATLRDQVTDLEREHKHAETRLARARQDAEQASKELEEERSKADTLNARVVQMERQLAAQTAEGEALARRLSELEPLLGEHARHLGDATRERDQLRLDLEMAKRLEQELRDELGNIDRRHEVATETLRSDKALLEGQLARASDERAKLQREIATYKQQAESSWEAERMENALLRERINDVSAEVARLTAALEGPESPIEAILAEDITMAEAYQNGANGAHAVSGTNGTNGAMPREGASLADRIRALQNRASRMPAG